MGLFKLRTAAEAKDESDKVLAEIIEKEYSKSLIKIMENIEERISQGEYKTEIGLGIIKDETVYELVKNLKIQGYKT